METEKMVTDSLRLQNDIQSEKEDGLKSKVLATDDPNGCPPVKKLKQGRLPFMPLDQKPRLISPQAAKKRKLSDPESPSAKTAKTLRPSIDDPHCLHPDENEVSSSSEAENIPSLLPHPKNVRHTLLRFLKPSEQVSSTNNEIIDLTDSSECTENSDVEKEVQQSRVEMVDDSVKNISPIKCDMQTSNTNGSHCDITLEKLSSAPQTDNSVNSCTENNKREGNTNISCQKDLNDCNQNDSEKNLSSASDSPCSVPTSVEPSSFQSTDLKEHGDTSGKLPGDEDDGAKRDTDDILNESQDELDSPNATLDSQDELNESQLSCDSATDSQNESAELTPAKSVFNASKLGGGNLDPSLTPSGAYSPSDPCRNIEVTPKRNVAPKAISAKKQQLLEEREKKKQELIALKEKQRLEREEQKRLEKEKKEKERLEKKAQLEHERQEKKLQIEKEKQEKKAQLEKERQEKLQQKEDEKRRKQEALDLKMEEKRKKEEEKKQKEEEKRKEEEEKKQKDQKVKSVFKSFFVKKESSPEKTSKDENENFMPFELKKNMRLAPARRRFLTSEEKTKLDQYYPDQVVEANYLKDIKSTKGRRSGKTWPKKITEDEVMIVHDSDTVKKVTYRTKLLQFHANYRPPYYGTWRKKSSALTPKNPFKMDKDLFDYEVDSDDEWEEEDPGESVSSDEEEEEKDKEKEDDDEEDDGWMVPHGYLSEDEGCEEDEITPESLQAKRAAKLAAWEAELKRQYQPALPVVIGCEWKEEANKEKEFHKILMEHAAVCIFPSPVMTVSISQNSKEKDSEGDENSSGKTPQTPSNKQRKPVPDEAMPDLIRLVHGNISGIKKLIREFRMYWHQKTSGSKEGSDEPKAEQDMEVEGSDSPSSKGNKTDDAPVNDVSLNCEDNINESINEGTKDTENNVDSFCISKRQLEMKIMAIAVREKRPNFKKICWHVNEGVLKEYNMEDISINNSWQYVSDPAVKKTEEATAVTGRKTPTIKAFTQPLSPSQIHASLQKKEEPPPVALVNAPNILTFTQPLSPSQIHASVTKKEESTKLPTTSKGILAFAQKITSSKNIQQQGSSGNENDMLSQVPSPKVTSLKKPFDEKHLAGNEEKCLSTSIPCVEKNNAKLTERKVPKLQTLLKQNCSPSSAVKLNASSPFQKAKKLITISSNSSASDAFHQVNPDNSLRDVDMEVTESVRPQEVVKEKKVTPPRHSKLSDMIANLVGMEEDHPLPDSTVECSENNNQNIIKSRNVENKKKLPFTESSDDCIIID